MSDSLPAADLLIGYFKSVLTWAPLVNVPGVYLNFFDQGYEFSNMQSITVSEDVQSAIATVKNILSESYIHVEQSKPEHLAMNFLTASQASVS